MKKLITFKSGFTLREGATHVTSLPIAAKFGFTLAEVLITLGIIGVVAAMTIPTLMTNLTAARYTSKFKKGISTLSQAVRLNKANFGWDFAEVETGCGGNDFDTQRADTTQSVCAIFNSNLTGIAGFYRENTLKTMLNYEFKGSTVGVSKGGTQYTVYALADGTFVGFRSLTFSSGCSLELGEKISNWSSYHKCSGFIDVNGATGPNEETKCSKGTTTTNPDVYCVVDNKDVKDVFPIVFHNDIVEGGTNAAQYVLKNRK